MLVELIVGRSICASGNMFGRLILVQLALIWESSPAALDLYSSVSVIAAYFEFGSSFPPLVIFNLDRRPSSSHLFEWLVTFYYSLVGLLISCSSILLLT